MGRDKRKYADRAKYLVKAVKKRRKHLRIKSIEYKGGKCISCGYNKCNEALDFHHIDESKKEFGLSEKGMTRSWERTMKELDKCILVCANCHRELHHGKLQLPTEMLVEKEGELSSQNARSPRQSGVPGNLTSHK